MPRSRIDIVSEHCHRAVTQRAARPRVALLALTFLAGALSAGFAAALERPHVLLITVDTLRADALGCYGAPGQPTPNIDALARSGALFEDTITPIGKTGPAFASLFTSLYPPTHGARRNGVRLRGDVPVLAELLSQEGYETAAFISNWTLRSNLAGVDRGFDHYDQNFTKRRYGIGKPAEREAPEVTEAALAWLDSRDDPQRPVFLWAHFSEPHAPYESHPGFIVTGGSRNKKQRRYASEVAFTDHWIGQLLERIEPSMPSQARVVVFLSDHGESLGEHDYWGHGRNTHWPNLDIPFLMAGAGVPRGVRIKGPASSVDVLPTLLDVLAISAPEQIVGRSLTAWWAGAERRRGQERSRYALADRGAKMGAEGTAEFKDPLAISLETQQIKTIYDFKRRSVQYFDLSRDPREERPLSRPPFARGHEPSRELASWYRGLSKHEATAEDLSQEDLQQLEALGYVESETSP